MIGNTMPQCSDILLAFGIGSLGGFEMVIVGIVAVILFGGKLPEVARNFGRTYQQFRQGLADIQSSFTADVDVSLNDIPRIDDYSDVDDYDEPVAPTFDEPPSDESSHESR